MPLVHQASDLFCCSWDLCNLCGYVDGAHITHVLHVCMLDTLLSVVHVTGVTSKDSLKKAMRLTLVCDTIIL